MKTFRTQAYHYVYADPTSPIGQRTAIACCAPRMMQDHGENVIAYQGIGPVRQDVCCHVGRSAEICRIQNEKLRNHLRTRGFAT